DKIIATGAVTSINQSEPIMAPKKPACSALLELKLVRKSKFKRLQPSVKVSTINMIRTIKPNIVQRKNNHFKIVFLDCLTFLFLAMISLSISVILIFLPKSLSQPSRDDVHN